MTPLRLTARETEILGLVFSGHTNAQIAARLYISERTVIQHMVHISFKAQPERPRGLRGIVARLIADGSLVWDRSLVRYLVQ